MYANELLTSTLRALHTIMVNTITKCALCLHVSVIICIYHPLASLRAVFDDDSHISKHHQQGPTHNLVQIQGSDVDRQGAFDSFFLSIHNFQR